MGHSLRPDGRPKKLMMVVPTGCAKVSNRGSFKAVFPHIMVSAAALLIFLADVNHSGLWHPDAPSHALNGIFYKDLISDAGFFQPVAYAERYYVQYPSLTMAMYPPVFYTVEAALYALLGLSWFSAKIGILLFTLVAFNVFYLLCKMWFPLWLAVSTTLLWLVQPATLFVQKNTMLEMPALAASLLALYCLFLTTKKGRSSAAFWAPLLAAVAFLVKQNTAFLGIVGVAWLVFLRKGRKMPFKPLLWGLLVGGVLAGPWILVNLTVGSQYLSAFAFQTLHPGENLLYYLKNLQDIVSYPIAILSLIALAMLPVLRRHDGYLFVVVIFGAVLLFVSFMEFTAPRYGVFAVPALVVLAVYPVKLLSKVPGPGKGAAIILTILLLFSHAYPVKAWASKDVRGFDAVAEFIVNDEDCVSVLYDGYFHSNFVFHMRCKDKDRRVFVFRSSKLIFSTKMIPQLEYRELVTSREAFLDKMDEYAVKYIVQEEKDSMRTAANTRLREWVQDDMFKLVKRYPMTSVGLPGIGDLLVYEYIDYKAKPLTQVELDMPMLGRKLTVHIPALEKK